MDNNNSKGMKIITIILAVIAICLMPLVVLDITHNDYESRLESKLERVRLPYVSQPLTAGMKITSDMISYVDTLPDYIEGSYYNNPNDIIGKCVSNKINMVYGSLFYKEILVECNH